MLLTKDVFMPLVRVRGFTNLSPLPVCAVSAVYILY